MIERGARTVSTDPAAQARWVEHVNETARKTLFLRANSWYLGANVPGKPRVFLPYAGGLDRYRKVCEDIALGKYAEFRFA